MKIIITGERGFIGRNLINVAESRGHEVIRLASPKTRHGLAARRKSIQGDLEFFAREPCVYQNSTKSWADTLSKFEIDLVVHNAAVVGTDVVALNPDDATLSNVTGTYNIVKACEMASVPISYMGTTVIYDTPKYQETWIDEQSDVRPTTLYGQLKYTGDMIVREAKVNSNIIRPLFAYGGIGDMNSLIAKSIFGAFSGRSKLDMFLDPEKYKDYMHVRDYCTAVIMAAEKNLWNRDYIVAAESPQVTGEIVDLIDDAVYDILGRGEVPQHRREAATLPSEIIQWHPETDYLGNHRLSSKSFREASGWSPEVSLDAGIREVADDLLAETGFLGTGKYNPFHHLDEAERRGVDLTKFY
jgi:dTDP-glucose 4,6-dehydratase